MSLKIISLTINIICLCTFTLYSYPVSKDFLRPPLNINDSRHRDGIDRSIRDLTEEVIPKRQYISVARIKFALPQHYVDRNDIHIYRTNITGRMAKQETHYLVIVYTPHSDEEESFNIMITSEGVYCWDDSNEIWQRIAQRSKRYINLLDIDSFSKFNTRIISLQDGKDRLKKIMKQLLSKGAKGPLESRQVLFQNVLLGLPRDYANLPKGAIQIVRSYISKGRIPKGEPYRLAILNANYPHNYLVFEYRPDGIYLIGKSPQEDERITLPEDGKVVTVSLVENSKFKEFDEKVTRSLEYKVYSSSDGKGGHTSIPFGAQFRFSGEDSFIVRRKAKGHAGYSSRGREEYILEIFKNKQGERGKKITEISYYQGKQGEFVIKGIHWSDGTPLVFKGRRFFIPRVVDKIKRGEFQEKGPPRRHLVVDRSLRSITLPHYFTSSGSPRRIRDYDLVQEEGIYKLVASGRFTLGEPGKRRLRDSELDRAL